MLFNVVLGLIEDKFRECGQPCQSPGDDAGDGSKSHSPGSKGKHSMDNGQVPINCQQDDEKDLTVQGKVIKPRDHFTHVMAKTPFIPHNIVNPEWNGEEKEQVRNCQVEQVDISHNLELPVLYEDQHNHHVAQEANDEYQGVQWR